MPRIKATVNCDLGEGFSLYTIADDAALMHALGTSTHPGLANIACGFHAGDFSTMEQTVKLAKKHGVRVGAHPSLPDRQGFGRREMGMEPDELQACFVYQIGAMTGFLRMHGVPLNHVKPHGAVYGQTARSLPLARAAVAATKVFFSESESVAFVGLAGTMHQVACEEAGVRFIPEWFADLEYDPSGKLLITKKHDPIPAETIRERVTRLLQTQQITANDGSYIPLGVGLEEVSICCHSDTPGALETVQLVKGIVEESNAAAGFA
ncbi:Lactam utilization protein lamB [Mycena kentingensis (nom. inval.)]|nr:Lactam utilization protein lamB [Mycena kentingensis (nom. inval.)]